MGQTSLHGAQFAQKNIKHDVIKLSINAIAQRVELDQGQNFTYTSGYIRNLCALLFLIYYTSLARSQLTRKRFLIPTGSIPGRTSASVGR